MRLRLKWNKHSVQANYWWVGLFDGVYLPLLLKKATLRRAYITRADACIWFWFLLAENLHLFIHNCLGLLLNWLCVRPCDNLTKNLIDMYCVNTTISIHNNAHSPWKSTRNDQLPPPPPPPPPPPWAGCKTSLQTMQNWGKYHTLKSKLAQPYHENA